MAQATPNLDKLEAIYLHLGGNSCDISRQVRSTGGFFWTVTRRDDAGFWIGQGDTLACALHALENVTPVAKDVDVAALDRLAA